jgi:hypothetical protein
MEKILYDEAFKYLNTKLDPDVISIICGYLIVSENNKRAVELLIQYHKEFDDNKKAVIDIQDRIDRDFDEKFILNYKLSKDSFDVHAGTEGFYLMYNEKSLKEALETSFNIGSFSYKEKIHIDMFISHFYELPIRSYVALAIQKQKIKMRQLQLEKFLNKPWDVKWQDYLNLFGKGKKGITLKQHSIDYQQIRHKEAWNIIILIMDVIYNIKMS